VQGLSPLWSKVQLLTELIALLLLAVAGALLVGELWPSNYLSLPTPQQDADWIEKLEKDLPDAEAVLDQVLANKLSRAMDRVEQNKRTNDRKSRLISWTFRVLSGAIILILGNLLCLAAKAAWPALKSLFI